MDYRGVRGSVIAILFAVTCACAVGPATAPARQLKHRALVLRAHRGADTFVIRASDTDSGSYSIDGSRPVRFSGISSLTIEGDGGDDVCRIVDPAHGLFAPPDGITCNGGNRRGQPRRGALQIVGGHATSSSYTPGSDAGAGTQIARLAQVRQVIRFSGLAPIIDNVPSSYTFIDSLSNDVVGVVDNGTAGTITIESLSDPAGFESDTISQKTHVTIDATNAGDSVVLENQSAETGMTALTVNANGAIALLGAYLPGIPVTLVSGSSITGAGPAPYLTASSLAATAPSGVGPLSTDVGTLAADSSAGGVDIDNAAPLTVAALAPLTGITAAGAVTLSADSMTLTGGTITSSGTTTLAPATSGVPISIGSSTPTAGDLSLSAADLQSVHAPELEIGNASAGGIVVSGAVAPTAVGTLGLAGPSGFSAAGGSISVPTLALTDLGSTGRAWTIGPSSISDGSGAAIPYASASLLEIHGGGGSNTLSYQAGGRAVTATGSTPAGAIYASGLAPVLYTAMAGVSVVDAGAAAAAPLPICALESASSRLTLGDRGKTASLSFLVSCDQAGSGTLRATVTATTKSKKHKTKRFSLRAVALKLAPGQIRRLTVRLSAAALKALRAGAREAVSTRLSATGATGTAQVTVHIKRLSLR